MSSTVPDLTAASTPLGGGEELHVVQSSNSRKTTVSELRKGTFLALTDTISAFTSNALLVTNNAGDAVASGFVVPSSLGTAGQVLVVNSAEDALEFDDPATQQGISFDNETSTTYSVTNADLDGNVFKEMDNASDITVTIPSGLTGTEPVTFEQAGAGAVIFSAGSGVTLNSFDSHDRTAGQHATVTLIPKGSDVYLISGNTASA